MKCVFCWHRGKIGTESIMIINGFSVCKMASHIEAASTFTQIKHALAWLNRIFKI